MKGTSYSDIQRRPRHYARQIKTVLDSGEHGDNPLFLLPVGHLTLSRAERMVERLQAAFEADGGLIEVLRVALPGTGEPAIAIQYKSGMKRQN